MTDLAVLADVERQRRLAEGHPPAVVEAHIVRLLAVIADGGRGSPRPPSMWGAGRSPRRPVSAGPETTEETGFAR